MTIMENIATDIKYFVTCHGLNIPFSNMLSVVSAHSFPLSTSQVLIFVVGANL